MAADSDELAQRINEHVRKSMNYKANLLAYNILMRRAAYMLLAGTSEEIVLKEITRLTQETTPEDLPQP